MPGPEARLSPADLAAVPPAPIYAEVIGIEGFVVIVVLVEVLKVFLFGPEVDDAAAGILNFRNRLSVLSD